MLNFKKIRKTLSNPPLKTRLWSPFRASTGEGQRSQLLWCLSKLDQTLFKLNWVGQAKTSTIAITLNQTKGSLGINSKGSWELLTNHSQNFFSSPKTLSVHLLVSSLRLSCTYTEAAVQSATFFG